MASQIETFLDQYKQLEDTIRSSGEIPADTVLDYENSLEVTERDKLKVCRILRNYIQHNPDGKTFVSTTASMCSFLRSLRENINALSDQVKDRTKKITPLHGSDTLKAAMMAVAKSKAGFVPLLDADDHPIGLLTPMLCLSAYADGAAATRKLGSLFAEGALKDSMAGVRFASPNDPLASYSPTETVIVLSKDKYKGVVVW